MRRKGLDDRQTEQAIRLHQQGSSLARVGTRFNVHAETSRQALRSRGVRMRTAWERG
jgi:hypothetical protein